MVDFVKVVPSGVVLKSIKQNGSDIVVTGFSEAGDGVSFFMRAVSDQASYLNGVYLQDMQASSYEGRSGFDFSVSMKVGPSAAASAAAAVVVKQRSSAAHGVL
jgi:Tfp pilus assembly protein PilN